HVAQIDSQPLVPEGAADSTAVELGDVALAGVEDLHPGLDGLPSRHVPLRSWPYSDKGTIRPDYNTINRLNHSCQRPVSCHPGFSTGSGARRFQVADQGRIGGVDLGRP